MNYTPTNWDSGDIITAEKLNKIEEELFLLDNNLPREITIPGATTVSQALDPGVFYHFLGTPSTLSISLNSPATGQLAQYHFDFNSNDNGTFLSLPSSISFPESFNIYNSYYYEIDILNNHGVGVGWPNFTN